VSASSATAVSRDALPRSGGARGTRPRWPAVVSCALLSVSCIVAVLPFLYLLSLSFKRSTSLFTYPPDWVPWPPFLGNYNQVLFQTPFPRWFLNTLLVAAAVTVLKLAIDLLAAYAFAKLAFPLKEPLFIFTLSTLMIPLAATLVPMFLVVRDLGLLNTYFGLMLPGLANPLGIFLLRGFIEQLPRDLDSAARLDGASTPYIVLWIVAPLCKPALATLAVYHFLLQWTNFLWPLVATNTDEMRLLTNGLAGLKGQFNVNWGLVAAGAVLVIAPMIGAFIIFMRQFVAGSLAGALKQ
jgi:multiple sugar transport system permease protein